MHNTVLVFDIDSTLADNSQRAALLARVCTVCLGSYDTAIGHRTAFCETCQKHTKPKITQGTWDKFMDPKAFAMDVPILGAAEFVDDVRALGYTIVYLTGRHERGREATEAWLNLHVKRAPTERLIMRDADNTPASQMKEKLFLRLRLDIEKAHSAQFIFFEDDPHVFDVYRGYGIVLKCPEAFTLGILNPKGDKLPEPVVKA